MRLILSSAFSITTILALSNCTPNELSPTEMIAAAEAIDRDRVKAVNKMDPVAAMAFYWDDPKLAILDEDEFIVGREAFDKVISTWFKKFKTLKFEFKEARNIAAGDAVFGQQKWSAEGERLDGTRTTFGGLHSDVKARRNGKWVIVSESWVRLPPNPEDALKQAEGLEKKYAEAYQARKLDEYLSNYLQSPDLIIIDVGLLIKGFDAWKGHIGPQMMRKGKDARFSFTESHNIPYGDLMLGYGRWTYTEAPGAKVYEGNYSNVKAFRGGKWVVVMDHYSEAAKKTPDLPRKH